MLSLYETWKDANSIGSPKHSSSLQLNKVNDKRIRKHNFKILLFIFYVVLFQLKYLAFLQKHHSKAVSVLKL